MLWNLEFQQPFWTRVMYSHTERLMETAVYCKKVHLKDPAMTVNKIEVLYHNPFSGKIRGANWPHKARKKYWEP